VHNEDANLFLLNSTGFDYIDIDPFGSPNPFLDSAIKRIAREGILAVTATDTAPLCGTYPKTCMRKYWAIPLHTYEMHEIGLRILIRKVQLIGAQYEKALVPMFSYSKDHYFRIFFRCDKGKSKVDKIISKHTFYKKSGPMWFGKLWDKQTVLKMTKSNQNVKNRKVLDIINDELDIVGHVQLHKFCKNNLIKSIPRKKELIQRLIMNGYKTSNTHFSDESIKTTADEKNLTRTIKSFINK